MLVVYVIDHAVEVFRCLLSILLIYIGTLLSLLYSALYSLEIGHEPIFESSKMNPADTPNTLSYDLAAQLVSPNKH